jgi:hypothetical protein
MKPILKYNVKVLLSIPALLLVFFLGSEICAAYGNINIMPSEIDVSAPFQGYVYGDMSQDYVSYIDLPSFGSIGFPPSYPDFYIIPVVVVQINGEDNVCMQPSIPDGLYSTLAECASITGVTPIHIATNDNGSWIEITSHVNNVFGSLDFSGVPSQLAAATVSTSGSLIPLIAVVIAVPLTFWFIMRLIEMFALRNRRTAARALFDEKETYKDLNK